MSGQLATWVGEHSKATSKGRAVLIQLALAAHPDGCPASDTTRADIERRTGLSLTTIREGLAEVRGLGEVKQLGKGGGRGRPTPYALVVMPCHPDADCWACATLAKALAKTGRHAPCFSGENRAPQRQNRAPRAPTTELNAGARARPREHRAPRQRETEAQRLARQQAELQRLDEHHVGGEAGDAGVRGRRAPGSEQKPARKRERPPSPAAAATPDDPPDEGAHKPPPRDLDQTWPAFADSRCYSGPGRLATPPPPQLHTPTEPPEPPEPIEIPIEPPEHALLDHDPDLSEILATLGDAFGDVQVLEGPATYRTARGRLIDLATASTDDLHQAVDQLNRHTCRRWQNGSERCTPDQPCERHTARRRAR